MTRPRLSWLLALASLTFPRASEAGAALAQDTSLPRFVIASREDLLAAVMGPDAQVRTAIVALEGRRALPWALDVLRDRSATVWAVEGVIRVLSFTLDSLAVDDLLRLAQEGDPIPRAQAREALVLFPYEPVCAYWRTTLARAGATKPERWSALAGLGYCGDDRDRPTLVQAVRGSADQMDSTIAAVALEMLQKPRELRHTRELWAGPPTSTGEFVPGDRLRSEIERTVCGGPCAAGRVLSPRQQLRNQGQ